MSIKLLTDFLNEQKIEFSVETKTLDKMSRDASIFEIMPAIVVYPKRAKDISAIVNFVSRNKGFSVTSRAGGTDMTGGPLTNSILIDLSKYLNKFTIKDDIAVSEPGVYFRDFDQASRNQGYILPSFPASRDYCAIGGMVANNSGGEKSLRYGKTADYIKSMKVVLSDGNEYKIAPLSIAGLQKKISQNNFEGNIYKKLYNLIIKNENIIKKSKPIVSKNSSGYALWDVWDGNIFDLTKLFCGSQGTLGLITSTEFQLIHPKNTSGMLVIFVGKEEYKNIPKVVTYLKKMGAETIEVYDKHTFKLASRYFYDFVKILGKDIVSLFINFLPEIWMTLRGGVPEMVILAEFAGDSQVEVKEYLRSAFEGIRHDFNRINIEINSSDIAKYRAIRRSSFKLLRERLKDKKPAAFIDDLIVPIDILPDFISEIEVKLSGYDFVYTIAGHLGDGNFHIVPLLSSGQIKNKEYINKIMSEVYEIVLKYKGSISAEHNDGLLRVDYLKKMFGAEMYDIFVEVKKIFDPQNIFNPGKKIKLP